METSTNGSNGQSQAADPHLQEVIRSAERELHELLERRAELMKRIGTIKQTLGRAGEHFRRRSAQRPVARIPRSQISQPAARFHARLPGGAHGRKETSRRPAGLPGAATEVSGGAGTPQGPDRVGDDGVEPAGRLRRSPLLAGPGRAPGLEVDCGTRGRCELARGRQRVFVAATGRKTVTGVTDCVGPGLRPGPTHSL